MPRLLALPDHQHPLYWLYKIGRSLSSMRKDFNHLCHISIEKLWKYEYMFLLLQKQNGFSKNQSLKELKRWLHISLLDFTGWHISHDIKIQISSNVWKYIISPTKKWWLHILNYLYFVSDVMVSCILSHVFRQDHIFPVQFACHITIPHKYQKTIYHSWETTEEF